MGSFSQRKQERFPVNFSVRFGAAREFVQEYAENLSTGGIFVGGAHRLQLGEQLIIELDLPGYVTFIVTAEVAHIITPEEATKTGRVPGAGLKITQMPEGFDQDMRDYLVRLGQRRDSMVLVQEDVLREIIKDSGYKVRALPPPSALEAVLATVKQPVIAVVVSEELTPHYAPVAEAAGFANLVISTDSTTDLDSLLRILDQRLPEPSSSEV